MDTFAVTVKAVMEPIDCIPAQRTDKEAWSESAC